MNLSATTAFKTLTLFQHANTASMISAPTGAWIVSNPSYTVHSASSNATNNSRCIALRYARSSSRRSPSLTPSKVWKDGFYQRTSLRELGFCFYISHKHTTCPSAGLPKTILVIHVNGAHYVDVQFCACSVSPGWVENYRQLLRICWYPASFNRPQTAFTFDLLDTYHKLTLQGKLNLYDFHSSIMQKTDNCGREKMIVSVALTTIGALLN